MPRDQLSLLDASGSNDTSTTDVDASFDPAHTRQWLSGTEGRIATDGFSWMQAVCWFRIDDTFTVDRDHGPKRLGDTTLRVAVALARLNPCRPGVAYLMRLLKLSKRTVQYHLAILREAGLLTYRSKGTRVSGQGGMASEYVWTIPPAFDTALHLRTAASEQYLRIVRGIEDAGRKLMKRLAKMAQRLMTKPRRTRPAKPAPRRSSSQQRCTPMGGSSSGLSSAGTSTSPSESKLGSGNSSTTPSKKPRTPRRLNAVGRRYRLAAELVRQVPWLHRAAVPRIAWVVRHVSDAGWSATEVIALLALQSPSRIVRRPSGFLAQRLHNAHQRFDTPARREELVNWWRDSREAEADRHTEWQGTWQAPRSRAVTHLVRRAIDAVRQGQLHEPPGQDRDQVQAGSSELTREELLAQRQAAHQAFLAGDTALVTSAVDFLGREAAEGLYGADLVARALRLTRASSHLKVRTLG
ncbi:helix-turn-helix domain-containing protein [Streptomyces sp. NPDC004658]|uniref:helix-turn-helix domain-containing protein n=1 Tax=Streptomyces TaxID=1883 RepID=UPI0033A1D534